MAEHAHTFLLVTILSLVTILLIFGMKYFSAARQARIRAGSEDAFRESIEKSALVQTASAASLAALQADFVEMKGKLTSIEKVLREVE
jgi:preprotein translocase subunit YajC